MTLQVSAAWIQHTTLDLASGLLFVRYMKSHEQTTPANQPLQKDPDDWKSGDEPMTAAQRSYLETLSADTGEAIDENLTKAEASKRIDELRSKSPRLNEA